MGLGLDEEAFFLRFVCGILGDFFGYFGGEFDG